MKLSEAKRLVTYHIESIDLSVHEDLGIRLMHLGFMENESVCIVNKTPLTSDAILVNIKGSQIALTKSEASIINICEIK